MKFFDIVHGSFIRILEFFKAIIESDCKYKKVELV